MDREIEATIRRKWKALSPAMNEAERRRWAGAEAQALGRGGITVVARATQMSRDRVRAGIGDLQDRSHAALVAQGGVRRAGAGRPRSTEQQPALLAALEHLVAPATRGDPMSSLRWTSKSTAKLAAELSERGFVVDPSTVAALLVAQGYSLQAPRKIREGGDHPDRDAQFQHIQAEVERMHAAEQPVVSIDGKKKELVGAFKNGGREWQPKGHPIPVNVYDFISDALFKAIPYGVYDVTRNEGWVSVGIDHETAEFAANTIRTWWRQMGRARYRQATELLLVADCGGSNSARGRAWKMELQDLADRTGLTVHVCHLPPGTSKWNKIEHRLFNQITMNWRGRPLETLEMVVQLIANTRTTTGLRVRAAADSRTYRTGRKVSKAEMATLHLTRDDFHGEWNYTLTPHVKTREGSTR